MSVKKLILSWQLLLVLSVVVAFLVGVQYAAVHIANSFRVETANIACVAQSFDLDDQRRVTFGLACDKGLSLNVEDSKLTVAYLRSPGPLVCTTYKAGAATCALRAPEAK